MKTWDPFIIFRYLNGIIPQHVAIIAVLLNTTIWSKDSLNENFPDQDVIDSQKTIIQHMVIGHSVMLVLKLLRLSLRMHNIFIIVAIMPSILMVFLIVDYTLTFIYIILGFCVLSCLWCCYKLKKGKDSILEQ